MLSPKRIEALVCTGSPGLYRVVVFFAIQHIYSLQELGHSASSMAIAQMAGFFTAIGWATLILVRVPAADSEHGAVITFYRLVTMSVLTTAVVSAVGVLVSLSGVIPVDLWPLISLLWTWTAYQVARHYFVALKRYRSAIAFDLALIAASLAIAWVFRRLAIPSSFSLAVALAGTAVAMFVCIGRPRGVTVGFRLDAKGLQFGLTNFLSGGIPLIFVPAATAMCGPTFAGLLSLLSSVTAVGLLMPRAISMAILPDLARRKAVGQPLHKPLRTMRVSIGWCNAVVLAVNVGLVLALVSDGMRGADHIDGIGIAGTLLAIQCAVGMMGMANSSVMMVFEQGAAAARVNLITSSAFVALAALSYWQDGKTGFLLILTSAITITVWRNLLIARHAAGACRQYAAGSRTVGTRGIVIGAESGAQQ